MASLSPQELVAALAALKETLSGAELDALLVDYEFWARPNQLPPAWEWSTWLVLAGRGFGKTWVGSHATSAAVIGRTPLSGGARHNVAIVAETAADARDVMVEGPAGILAQTPKDYRPLYEPSKRRLTWPNGATGTLFNATEPDQLRGPQHDWAWCDEAAKWQYAQETWDMLQFGMRLGRLPQVVVTTTPRPIKLIKELLADPGTAVTRGATMDNRANLAASFIKKIHDKYEGTRLGRQELYAEVLDDVPGALWRRQQIEASRVRLGEHINIDDLQRIVVAIDPPATSGEDADECGIVVCGIDRKDPPHLYVLQDLSFPQASPTAWASTACAAFHQWKADRIIGEVNNGGEMVEAVIRAHDPNVPLRSVHATRGKVRRAEPIAALWEQGRGHIVGAMPQLEDQMAEMTPDFDSKVAGYSPDHLDAMVWAATDLTEAPTDDLLL